MNAAIVVPLCLLLAGGAGAFRMNLSLAQRSFAPGDLSDRSYRHDCWKMRPVSASMLQRQEKDPGYPGTGINKFEPFKRVLKDGYMKVACVKDEL